ncbi:LysE family translocator [Litoribrevibacter albus]|uniref:Threonine transporter RhtB n=1 Tax=Litoribrevibacter albus TaxID=1473156 RepID=A0AA37SBD6_9GAMM|nr:LysE family translocator [Litoribrevibacter albus]GLQ31594.1 threonine transporter RhtB [Litoribrevibacter albus]
MDLNFISLTVLAVFIPTFFFVSVTPGMCMTLAMTMGMTIGVRRTMWMMSGELIGVGLVATLSVIGVAAIMLNYPMVFDVFKYLGGGYLGYLGLQLWQSKGKMALNHDGSHSFDVSRRELAVQGFVTAVANPKGWAFFVALLPPFIDVNRDMAPQLVVLLSLILLLELICLMLYAAGGKTVSHLLQSADNVKVINRLAGTLMIGVGIWLAFG